MISDTEKEKLRSNHESILNQKRAIKALHKDVGFKAYNPEINNKNRWFQNTSFNTAVYNIGINYPF